MPLLWWLLTFLAAGLTATSILLTVFVHIDPCHLCIFQRLLFMLLAIGCAGAAWYSERRWVGLLVPFLAAAGIMVATYQSWLQAQPVGSVSCMGSELGPIEQLVEWLGQQIPELFLATGFCENAGFFIFGLSLANWALVIYFVFFVLSLWILLTHRNNHYANFSS